MKSIHSFRTLSFVVLALVFIGANAVAECSWPPSGARVIAAPPVYLEHVSGGKMNGVTCAQASMNAAKDYPQTNAVTLTQHWFNFTFSNPTSTPQTVDLALSPGSTTYAFSSNGANSGVNYGGPYSQATVGGSCPVVSTVPLTIPPFSGGLINILAQCNHGSCGIVQMDNSLTTVQFPFAGTLPTNGRDEVCYDQTTILYFQIAVTSPGNLGALSASLGTQASANGGANALTYWMKQTVSYTVLDGGHPF